MVRAGFKNTEIGEIPGDWEVVKIGEIAQVLSGGTPSTFVSSYWNGNIEWFTPTEVGYSKYLYSSKRKITDLGFKNASANLLPVNSILLTTRAGIGDLGILKVEGCTNQGFQSFICNPDSYFEFVYYLMCTQKAELLKNSSGSTFLEISPTKIINIQIPLPPLPEQKAIAEALSDADAWIENLEQLIAKKRLIKQGAMQKLLTPKQDWKVKKLGEVIESTQLGGNYPNSENVNENPLIKMGNIQRGYISTRKLEYIVNNVTLSSKDLLHENDLLFNTRNTLELVGKVSIWRNELPKAYFNSNIMRIIFKKEIIVSTILMNAIFNSKKLIQSLKDIATGTTSVAAIYTRDLLNIEINFPRSLAEQTRIATILSDMDTELEGLENTLGKARQIKQGMMQELLTGKIRLI
jgi:type I restriction enzyme S subunit